MSARYPLPLPGMPARAEGGSMSAEHTEGLSSSADKFPPLIWQPWIKDDPAALCGSLFPVEGKEPLGLFQVGKYRRVLRVTLYGCGRYGVVWAVSTSLAV